MNEYRFYLLEDEQFPIVVSELTLHLEDDRDDGLYVERVEGSLLRLIVREPCKMHRYATCRGVAQIFMLQFGRSKQDAQRFCDEGGQVLTFAMPMFTLIYAQHPSADSSLLVFNYTHRLEDES